MRVGIHATVLIVATGLTGSGSAAPANTLRPTTVVASPTQILEFAGDGDWVAWSARGKRCASRLHLLFLRTNKQTAIRQDGDALACQHYGSLALARSRAAWTSLIGFGHTERDIAVSTASAAAPRPRRIRSMAMMRPEFGEEPAAPPIAGRGDTLAYYRHEDGIGRSPAHTVERVARSRPQRLFDSQDPVALAVDRGRVAAVRRRVDRGDACNCNSEPAWSPDGTKLAFILVRQCCVGDKEQADVYVMNADGTGRRQLTTDARPKGGVAWSPDGTHLAFGYIKPDFAPRLAIVNVDGTGLHDIAAGLYPSWSPDGTKLVFNHGGSVAVVDADGANLHEIGVGAEPAWSPDGSRIAFSSNTLYSARTDGTDKRRLARDFNSPSWSPDGSMIAGYGLRGIKLARADGGGVTFLHNTERGDAHPSWSPDGRRIAFDGIRNDLVRDSYYQPELYVTAITGATVEPLTFHTYDEWSGTVQVRSDSGRLLFGSTASGEPLAVALDGRYQVVLTRRARTTTKRLQVFEGADKFVRGIAVPTKTTLISARDGRAVFAAGKTVGVVDLRTGRTLLLAVRGGPVVGIAISGRRVTWAENVGTRGWIRSLLLRR